MNDPDPPPAPVESALEVAIQNPNRYPEAGARRLRPWLESLVRELCPEASSFAVRFVGDRAMRRWNRRYRRLDAPTDVLSFEGETGPDGLHLGDVVISVPTARRQAERRGRPPETELRVLLLHGVLHCLGHDHESDEGEMERLERRLRRRWIEDA